MEPAVLIDGGLRGFFVFVIAEHDVRSFAKDLSRHIGRVGAVYLHLHVDNGLATRARYKT